MARILSAVKAIADEHVFVDFINQSHAPAPYRAHVFQLTAKSSDRVGGKLFSDERFEGHDTLACDVPNLLEIKDRTEVVVRERRTLANVSFRIFEERSDALSEFIIK